MSQVFFGGRLINSPATVSVVDDSALANQSLSVGNVVALIGPSVGGKPKTELRFGSPTEARNVLRAGELLTAVLKAFDPSAQTDGPSTVVAMRINPATQATLTLKDASTADSITLKSSDYGAYTSQIKIKVETGSASGKKVTTQLGNDFFVKDNIARPSFTVRYSGAQVSAVMTIFATSIILQAPTGTTVATIDLTVYDTVQKVVDRINSVTGFAASVQGGNGAQFALNGLDFISSQDVRTADYTVQATLQAMIDWINDVAEGFIDATRASGAGQPPANIGFTYLAGGSDGSITNNDWSDGYTALQSSDVQWVTPISSDPSIHAMNDAHCTFMSNVARSERRGIVGMALNTSDATAIAAAKSINSDRTSLVHIGIYDFNDDGVLTLYPPYILAALLVGAFSGVSPGTPLTNKAIKVRGLERSVRNPTDTDPLISGGVMPIENTPSGFKVVKSITTWLVNSNFNRVEVSTGAALDFVARNVRNALDVLRGAKGTQGVLGRAASIVDSTLRELSVPEPQGPGTLVGNSDSPAFKNISVSLDGDRLRVQFQCSPVIPVNYILVSIFATPFSGVATA